MNRRDPSLLFWPSPPALPSPRLSSRSAEAQVPPRNGACGRSDRDGVPNVYDQHNNSSRQQAWGDRDHDGVPNVHVRYDNRRQQAGATATRDRDGVPNRLRRVRQSPDAGQGSRRRSDAPPTGTTTIPGAK